MNNYIVYHNPDERGFPANESDFSILTNKAAPRDVSGSTIWLITGEGRPREFFLALKFVATAVESGEDEGFRTRISGEHGQRFDPMIRIDDQPWFAEFKRRRANFSLGFGEIKDLNVVAGLERLAARVV
jgi:hypothetical protein